jgi:hypothetical protein
MTSSRRSKAQIERFHSRVEIIRGSFIAVIISIIVFFDVLIFKDMFDDLKEMLIESDGWVYFALSAIFSLILFRMIERLREVNEAANKKRNETAKKANAAAKKPDEVAEEASETRLTFVHSGILILGCGILLMLYFISLTTYANAIFPYIPFAKGGADYTAAARVDITIRPHGGESDAKSFANDVLVLYTTPTAIYVAKYKGPNDPCKWRTRSATPIILEVARREIQSITASAAPSGTLHPNCNVP